MEEGEVRQTRSRCSTTRLESEGLPSGSRLQVTIRLLREMGVRGNTHRQAVKDLSRVAGKGSQWVWMKRKDSTWAFR